MVTALTRILSICALIFPPGTINRNVNIYHTEGLSPFHIKDVFAIYVITILRQVLCV